MKKKSVFLSKVFAVALAASMAFSAPFVSADTISTSKTYDGEGIEVTNSGSKFWGGFSDYYRVSGDFDVTINFTNKGDGVTNWCNYVVVFCSAVDGKDDNGEPNGVAGYKEYLVVRADSYSWSIGDFGGTNLTYDGNPVTFEYDGNMDTFAASMKDAKVSLNIKRTGDNFAAHAVVAAADGNTYNYKFNFTTKADKDMNIFLTGEAADIKVQSFVVNGESASTETPDTTTGGAVDTTPETPAEDTTTPETPAEDTTTPETPAEDTTTPETPAEDTTTPETPAEDTTTPETPAEDTTTPETPAEPEDTTTAPAEDEEPAEEETVKAAAKLNKKKATVKVGKSVKLKVQNTTKKVTWSSSNKKVAKVSKSGKVTGVKAGKAVIKAKVGGKTLKCNVTVK